MLEPVGRSSRRAAIVCVLAVVAACARPARLDESPAIAAPRPPERERHAPPPRGAAEPREPEAARERAGGTHEALEGYGAATAGGAGERVVVISDPSETTVRKAFADVARNGYAILRFAVDAPIRFTRPPPIFWAPHVTIEGDGATLDGTDMPAEVALLDVRAHDVIVRDLRVRNGYDNLRAQGPDAYNVVFTHVSSTGARDDGISIAGGAHDVTVQYAFLAGNTRSVFCKYAPTTNVSLHHTWMQKGFIRSPLFSGPIHADVRNVIVEDWGEWGSRFEDGASGNVVGSLWNLSPHAHALGGKPNGAFRLRDAGPVYAAGNDFRGLARPGDRGDVPAPLPAPPVKTLPVADMEHVVRARAGCQPRDAVDRAYIELGEWKVTGTEPLRVPVD